MFIFAGIVVFPADKFTDDEFDTTETSGQVFILNILKKIVNPRCTGSNG